MKKKLVAIILALVLMTAALPVGAAFAASGDITLIIDGNRQSPSVPPRVVNGVTLVPLRIISETLGADVGWNSANRTATITTAAYTVVFTINSKDFTVNGARKTLDEAPQIVDGSTLVPIRAFAESIGATVNYNASSRTATIDYFTKMSGTLTISGSTTAQPIAQAAADKLIGMNTGLSITVSGGGSGTGINDARSGSVHIGMSSRELTDTEMRTLNTYEIAKDAIALIVHPSNPVRNLTKDQARDIFTGAITNWNQVGGNNAPIILMTRETGSGTLSTLNDLLLGSGNSVADRATPHASSALMLQAVARDANSIGFDSIGFVDGSVKALQLNGTTPSAGSVNNGTYGMSRALYVCTRGRATGMTAIFIDYLRSLECQRSIVSREGYVPLV